MSMLDSDKNNFFKEKIILEPKNQRNSISTNETFENEIYSDNDIDFNQDFFPKPKTFKFTDMLIHNWENKIKPYYDNIIKGINDNTKKYL